MRTLGCRLNQAESFEIEQGLISSGFEIAGPSDDPDVVIVNTCTVTRDSSSSSRRLIAKSVREFPDSRIVVTGCYAVAAPDEVRSIKGVTDVVPNKGKDSIVGFLRDSYHPVSFQSSAREGAVPPRVTIKVQTGCDEMCTFCIVPYTRGGLESRDPEEILATAVSLAERGAAEITLSGVHLGKYGVDRAEGLRLFDLVSMLLEALPVGVRIRLSSIEATCVDDRIIDLMASEPRLCRHLHIPLQSGDDAVLARMGRPYRASEFVEIACGAKERVEGLAITTDVMVGMPGETVEAFENTLKVIERIGFAKLHVFRYSAREGTPAAGFEGQISEDEKKARSKIVRELGDALRLEFHRREAQRGVISNVLVEGYGPAPEGSDDGTTKPTLFGITDNYIKVETSGPAGTVGRIVAVAPTRTSVEKVEGDLILDHAHSDTRS